MKRKKFLALALAGVMTAATLTRLRTAGCPLRLVLWRREQRLRTAAKRAL